MYNQMFTGTWHLDRCMEASYIAYLLYNPYLIGSVLILTLFIFFQTKWKNKVITSSFFFRNKVSFKPFNHPLSSALLSVTTGLLLVIPVMGMFYSITLISGFLIFMCSFGPMWDRIKPAHEIHARLIHIRENGGQTPRTLKEFKQIYPEEFEKIAGRAEVEYEYHPDHDGYRFTIRPSRYVYADFSDEQGYRLYRTNSPVSKHIFTENEVYKKTSE